MLESNNTKKIIETEAFTCLLLDGSLIRAAYAFDGEQLVSHNLLWWPSPFKITKEDLAIGGLLELFDLYSDKSEWTNHIVMRTPLRFDLDIKNAKYDHPASHLHMQTANCRIHVDRPISFNRFITFIFRNFYPEEYRKHDFWNDLFDMKLIDDDLSPQLEGEVAFCWS